MTSSLLLRPTVFLCTAFFGIVTAWSAANVAEAPSLVVTTVADVVDSLDQQTSLREALAYAATLTGPQTIAFSDGTNGTVNFADGTARTIILSQGYLYIQSAVTIAGPGAKQLAVDGNHVSAVFGIERISGDVALQDLTIRNGGSKVNIAGGGIACQSNGKLTLLRCHFTGHAVTLGGALYLGGNGQLLVSDSTFSNNSANQGGAIFNSSNTEMTILNSTFSGNMATVNDGGALENQSYSAITIVNSTFTGNTSADVGGAISKLNGGTVTIRNSIIAGNTATRLGPDVFDQFGSAVQSDGTNFIGDPGTNTEFPNDRTFASTGTTLAELLSPLADNGGPTPTHSLPPGSAAIDAGDANFNPAAYTPPLATDQRGAGFTRVVQGKPASAAAIVDIGAYEVQVPAVTFSAGVADNGVTVDIADAPLDLTGAAIGAAPSGGTFTGRGVDANGFFHPEQLVTGTYTITYTGSSTDAYGNTPRGSFQITAIAANPYLQVIADAVPDGSGIDVPGEPAGTKFTQFGLASMDSGAVGARVRIKAAGGPEVPAIFVGDAATASGSLLKTRRQLGIVVRAGDPAPAASRIVPTLGTFASFKEPVFGGGVVAVGATIAGSGVTKGNDTGLWSTFDGPVSLVAGEGGAANNGDGTPLSGVFFDQILSYVLSPYAGNTLTFVATLKGAGVTGANRTGIWQKTATMTPRLIFRTGDTFNFSEGSQVVPRAIQSLKLFVPAKTIPGQRRSYATTEGTVLAFATFGGGHEGLVRFSDYGSGTIYKDVVLRNTSVGHPGLPSVNRDSWFAMRAKLSVGAAYTNGPGKVTAGTDQVILVGNGQFNIGIRAQEGTAVSSTDPEVFTAFEEPAFNDDYNVAFFAKVKAPGLPASQQSVLVYFGIQQGNYNPTVIARTGTDAADLKSGARWKEFTAMALPDSDYGPVFLAKLTGTDVTAKNSIGLWATEADGTVRLVVRTGDVLSINGTSRTVSLITTLGAALDSPGQGRYVDLLGNVSATLTFTDGTTALVHFGMPTPAP